MLSRLVEEIKSIYVAAKRTILTSGSWPVGCVSVGSVADGFAGVRHA